MAKSALRITVPFGTETIRERQFRGDKTVKEFILPSTVRAIEKEAFEGCSSLEKITIPEGVERIRENAFHGCSSLVNISLPSTLSFIGEFAFGDCSSLEEVVIPDTARINARAFEGCTSLRSVVVREIIPKEQRDLRRVAVLIADPRWKRNTKYFGVMVCCRKRDDLSVYAVKLVKDLLYMAFKDSALYLDWEDDYTGRAPLSEVLEYDRHRYTLLDIPSGAEVRTMTVDSVEYIIDEEFYRRMLESSSPDWKPLS